MIDAAAGAYQMYGLDENRDAEKFNALMPDALWKAGATTITLDHVVKNALTTVASPWGWCLFSGLHSSHPRSTVERDREAAGRESRFHACSDVTRGRPESITVRPTRSAPRAGKTEVPSGMIR